MAERKPIKGITKEKTERLIADTLAEMPEKPPKNARRTSAPTNRVRRAVRSSRTRRSSPA